MKKILTSLRDLIRAIGFYPKEQYHAILHASFSFLATVIAYYILYYLHSEFHFPILEEKFRLIWCTLIGMIPGTLKELIDKVDSKFFNKEDMYYNMLGVHTAWVCILLVEF